MRVFYCCIKCENVNYRCRRVCEGFFFLVHAPIKVCVLCVCVCMYVCVCLCVCVCVDKFSQGQDFL